MIRNELESQLENAKNNFVLVLSSVSLLKNDECLRMVENSFIEFGGFKFEPKQLLSALSNQRDKAICIREFLNMGL